MSFAVTSSRLKIYNPHDYNLLPQKDRYTISEISYLCGISPKDLKAWSNFFSQLRYGQPRTIKRFLNPQEVLVLLHIRELVYNQGLSPTVAKYCLDEIDITQTETKLFGYARSYASNSQEFNFRQLSENQVDSSLIDDSPIIISATTPIPPIVPTHPVEASSMTVIAENHVRHPDSELGITQHLDPLQELNELNHLINNVMPLFKPNNQWSEDQMQSVVLDVNLDNTNLDDIPDRIEFSESTQDHFTAEQIEKIKTIHDLEFQAQQSTLQGHSSDVIENDVKTQYANLYLTRLTLIRKELNDILNLLTV